MWHLLNTWQFAGENCPAMFWRICSWSNLQYPFLNASQPISWCKQYSKSTLEDPPTSLQVGIHWVIAHLYRSHSWMKIILICKYVIGMCGSCVNLGTKHHHVRTNIQAAVDFINLKFLPYKFVQQYVVNDTVTTVNATNAC